MGGGEALADAAPLPRYHFRPAPPSLWEMARHGVSDTASVIPAAILSKPAIQLPGPGAPLVVADPGLVREVLNDRDGLFVRDRFMRRLLRRAWGNGLAAAEGPHWRAQRQAAAPAFRPQAVEANGPAFAAAAGRAALEWPEGTPVDVPVLAARIIADIVFTTLVDGRGEVDTAAVAADMPAYVRRIAGFGLRDLAPLPEAWHDWLSGIGRDPVVQRVRALARQLAQRRAGSGQRDDLITLLAGVGAVDENRVDVGHVDPALDDRRTEEHIGLVAQEGVDAVLELADHGGQRTFRRGMNAQRPGHDSAKFAQRQCGRLQDALSRNRHE